MRRLAVLFTLLAFTSACGDGDSGGSGRDGIDVVAAFYPLAEAARQVGGDDARVADLTPAGAEPHDLELTPDQAGDLEDADVAVVMGHDFQPAIEDFVERRDGATVIVLDQLSIDATDLARDPHVWLDPQMMEQVVGMVEAALAEADPENATTYAANAQRYRAVLATLDDEYTSGLADCERRELVTAHEAFGWLARRYRLRQHPIAGISPDQEPPADRIAELADLAERAGVTTIFTESLVSPDVAETVAREAGGLRVDTLNPLEGLTDDEIAAGADFVSVMRDNLQRLRSALACS